MANAATLAGGYDAPDEMVVASHLEWVWRDLSAGVAGRWPVRRSRGGDVPEVRTPRTAWWVATAHAARLVAHGVELYLQCVPAGWVAELPPELTGRQVTALRLGGALANARELPRRGFAKPARAKLDALEAQWYDDLPAALRRAHHHGVHANTVIEVCDTWLDLTVEYRSFVVAGDAATPSPYRVDGATWEPGFDDRADIGIAGAHRFAREVAAQLHRDAAVPEAWVLDVARTDGGEFVVVEANAPWSSGTYGCDLTRVADAAAISSTPPAAPAWRWEPDPSELAAARDLPPLRRG